MAINETRTALIYARNSCSSQTPNSVHAQATLVMVLGFRQYLRGPNGSIAVYRRRSTNRVAT